MTFRPQFIEPKTAKTAKSSKRPKRPNLYPRTYLSGQVSYAVDLELVTITITGYTGPGGAVAIPGTIDGLPVTSIGDWAFWSSTALTSVTIPNGVTSIGDSAFYGNSPLPAIASEGIPISQSLFFTP